MSISFLEIIHALTTPPPPPNRTGEKKLHFFHLVINLDIVESPKRIHQKFNQVNINFVLWIEGSIICQANYDFPIDFYQTNVVRCFYAL